jgi:hypothetical protein
MTPLTRGKGSIEGKYFKPFRSVFNCTEYVKVLSHCEKTACTQPKSSKTEWIDNVIGVQTHEEVRSKSRPIYTNTSMKFSQRGNKHEERHQDMAEQRRLPRRSGTRRKIKLQHQLTL